MKPLESDTAITAAIIAKNEERKIAACLESVKWADEIVVLDSLSTDRTVDICHRYTDRVFFHPFENYSKQRNYALGLIRTPWVLFVDADERVPAKLATEIVTTLLANARDPQPCAGYWIPRHNRIWGKTIRHAGWYPDYQLRLIEVAGTLYDEDRDVHEEAIVPGPTARLANPLVHHNYETVAQFVRKQRAYGAHEAELLRKKGVRSRPKNLIGAPAREFALRYIQLRGYAEGWRGLALSSLLAWYKFRTYQQLRRERDD